MSKTITNIITPGDQFAKKGTVPWADWQRSRLKHALKDVNFEARQIVQVIRDMCEGDRPAWHLMTRHEGSGFRTFEEFVTSPEGLTYPDYQKFRGLAISEPGVMNEREYDLLTAAPAGDPGRPDKENHAPGARISRRATGLRAIHRAPALVRELYVAGLIDAKLAELLGPDEKATGHEERQKKASRALTSIQAIVKNGDDHAYRKAVNEAVRREFADRAVAGKTPLVWLRHWWEKASKKERQAFLKEVSP